MLLHAGASHLYMDEFPNNGISNVGLVSGTRPRIPKIPLESRAWHPHLSHQPGTRTLLNSLMMVIGNVTLVSGTRRC